jgi:Ribose/xylose/arabinose/galactoside ABC-type transport systems, permease components
MDNRNEIRKEMISEKLCGMSTIIIMLIVMGFFAIANALDGVNFLTGSNISSIINQSCFLVVVGIGQALVLLTGGIDLSMGGVMSFSTVLFGGMLLRSSSVNLWIPVILILTAGAVIGLINGLLITKLHITPYIATFATMYSCRGLAWVYLRNRVLYPLNNNFRLIATGRIFNIGKFSFTVPMLIALLLLLIFYLILKHTNFGRRVYFTGANPTAAKFSGINTDRIIILIYTICSLLAAFAGLMYVARLNACEPGLATKTHFEAITVALIGGFAMSGGYGNIWGIIGSSIVVYTIQAGMNSLQMPSELQTLVNGVLIIFAVFLNSRLSNKKMELQNDISEKMTKMKNTKLSDSKEISG